MDKVLVAIAAFWVGVAGSAILCVSTIVHLRRQLRIERESQKEPRKPMEFKKKLAAWAATLATAAFVASYVLAVFDKQTVSDVTNTVFTACIGYLISYSAASLGEKASRNKHGLDADGNPIKSDPAEAPPEKAEEPADAGTIIT